MPTTTLLRVLAALVLPSLVHLARAADAGSSHVHRLKSLAEECAFKLGDVSFDLCPVLEVNEGAMMVAHERRTSPTLTKTEYRISLRAPLGKLDGVPGHEQVSSSAERCESHGVRQNPAHGAGVLSISLPKTRLNWLGYSTA